MRYFFALCILFVTCVSHVSAKTAYDKVYISPKAVMITNKGIAILHKGREVIVKSIYRDRKGIYIKKFIKFQKISWPCPRKDCDVINPNENAICWRCGRGHRPW